tara:strand:+ start:1894 stop:2628 length:735 start_codon:yes stop_codon:yes gene_type:complete
MKNTIERTIGQMVADDYRTAQIFKKYKIDFCCNGNRSIDEVAKEKNLNVQILLKEIDHIQQRTGANQTDFNEVALDQLADHIENKHHHYVETQIPVLKQYLHKLCKVHGIRHPELFDINEHFNASAGELTMHMKKEELVLFPWIRKMIKVEQQNNLLGKPHFGTVKNPIAMMMQEHENEGERFMLIAKLSNDYTPPEDACTTYKVAFSLLKEFESDLHEHIHLENNILFPKAVTLENQLGKVSG